MLGCEFVKGKLNTALVVIVGLFCLGSAPAISEQISIFAAASLKNALDEIAVEFYEEHGVKVVLTYAASSTLARQIEHGAPADIFFSADQYWMRYLSDKGLIDPKNRQDLLGNRLVVIAPKGARVDSQEGSVTSPLADLAPSDRVAMANVEAVPAGVYGKEALENLGLWPSVEENAVQADNVRSALALVALMAASRGIVYASDAVVEDRVEVVWEIPQESHPPIIYPVAATAGSSAPSAIKFLGALSDSSASEIFEKNGFLILDGAS